MSRELTLKTEKTKLEEKFEKNLGYDAARKFVADHESMSKEQLEQRMLDLAKTGQGIINTRNADTVLADLKAKVSEQSKKHNDQIKANADLVRFVSLVISEKYGDDLMDLQPQPENEDEE